jgi:hypothetical protein
MKAGLQDDPAQMADDVLSTGASALLAVASHERGAALGES